MANKTFGQKFKDKLFPRSEIMLYKQNRASYFFCLLALILNCLMFLHIYGKASCTPNILLGVDLVINIIFMLLAFLFAENEKKYDKVCAYLGIGLGVVEIIRIFILPTIYHNKYLARPEGTIVGLPTGDYIYCVILMSIAAVCLFLGSAICIYKTTKIENYLNTKKAEEK